MAAPIPVLVNRGGGTAAGHGDSLAGRIGQAFADAGVVIDLRLVDGAGMAAAAAAAAGAPVVAVGGGDGTLGCAAGELAGSGSAMAILPLGTRNHLAKELGIPADLAGAARLIAERPTRAIDLGRVDAGAERRVFVNNASIGLYPELVQRRDDHPAPKWLAAVPAAAGALRRLRHHRLRLEMPGERHEIATPLLFVGNNRYLIERGAMAGRDALDGGRLSVFALASRHRLGLVATALRLLLGRADRDHDFAAVGETAMLTVHGRSRAIDVALDGEVVRLPMPLAFRSDPGALTVVAPPAA